MKYIVENSGSIEDAKDVFQESIIIIYKISQRKPIKLTAGFYTYFFAICQRVWWKKLRKRKTANAFSVSIKQMSENTDPITLLDERYELYTEQLRQLPPERVHLMNLYLDGFKMKDIAQILQLKSEDYARKLKYKCQKQLIQLIREDKKYKELVF